MPLHAGSLSAMLLRAGSLSAMLLHAAPRVPPEASRRP